MIKKIIITVAICSAVLYAIQPFTYFWTLSPTNSQATTQKWRANNDSVLFWAARICDTVNTVVFKKSWVKDSTFDSINVRKLKHVDSLYARTIKVAIYDSINTNKGINGRSATFSGVLRSDSTNFRVIKANGVIVDTVNSTFVGAGVGRFNKVYTDSFIITLPPITTTYGKFPIKFTPGCYGGIEYGDTVYYKKEFIVELGVYYIGLWFNFMGHTSSSNYLRTESDFGVPMALMPTVQSGGEISAPIKVYNDGGACNGGISILSDRTLLFTRDSVKSNVITSDNFFKTSGFKGYSGFHISYLQR